MVKAILFDMDGVLINSVEAWFRVFNYALGKYGLPEVTRDHFVKKCWGVASDIIVPKYFKGHSVEEVTSTYFNKYFDFDTHIGILPNVEEVLKETNGFKKAVVTNTIHEQAEKVLKQTGLLKYFDVIVASDDVKFGKPDPEMLLKACEVLKVKKEDAVFIGDSSVDIAAGRKAGVFTIGMKINADKRIENLKELLEIVK